MQRKQMNQGQNLQGSLSVQFVGGIWRLRSVGASCFVLVGTTPLAVKQSRRQECGGTLIHKHSKNNPRCANREDRQPKMDLLVKVEVFNPPGSVVPPADQPNRFATQPRDLRPDRTASKNGPGILRQKPRSTAPGQDHGVRPSQGCSLRRAAL
jgi:hypothetical protein